MINALHKIYCKQNLYDCSRRQKSKKAALFAPRGRKAMLAAGLIATLTTKTAHAAATNICENNQGVWSTDTSCIEYLDGISDAEKTNSQITTTCSTSEAYLTMEINSYKTAIRTLLIISDHRSSQVGDNKDADLYMNFSNSPDPSHVQDSSEWNYALGKDHTRIINFQSSPKYGVYLHFKFDCENYTELSMSVRCRKIIISQVACYSEVIVDRDIFGIADRD